MTFTSQVDDFNAAMKAQGYRIVPVSVLQVQNMLDSLRMYGRNSQEFKEKLRISECRAQSLR